MLGLLYPLWAQVRCPSSGALDEAQLTAMIKDAAREPRSRLFIAACGVTFPLTPEVEARLRAAGATDNTITALREKAPKPADTPSAATEKSEVAAGTLRKALDGVEYVWIPPGKFEMGCLPGDNDCAADEKPRHEIRIGKGFWIAKTMVTQTAYQKVTGDNPSFYKDPDLPVEKITWSEAQKYCQSVQGRLPTEAEWEYAARAGDGDVPYVPKMQGDVWQWTADWFDDKYYQHSPAADPPGAASGQTRAVRGGISGDEQPRLSERGKGLPGFLYFNVGIRCVRPSMP